MFERYTEKARRVIFFSRYEASRYGTLFITTEHLLLGLLREDRRVFEILMTNLEGPTRLEDNVRAQQQRHKSQKVSTSVDLPLDNPAKRALAYAAEEAERWSDRDIGTEHLLLGLLREPSPAAETLQAHGIDLAKAREKLRLDARRSAPVETTELRASQLNAPGVHVEFVDANDLLIAIVTSAGIIPRIGEEIFFGSRRFLVANVSYAYPEAAALEGFSKKLPRIRVRLEVQSDKT